MTSTLASTRHIATRRSQRLTAIEIGIVVVVCALLITSALLSGGTRPASVRTSTVTVRSGDTLWSMARSYPVEGLQTAEAVELIAKINHLDTDVLQTGQTLMVPIGDAAEAVAMR